MIPNPVKFFTKPEYFFRPSQVIRRFALIGKQKPSTACLRLPWGASVNVNTSENVGSEIYHYGIFDPIVPEAIFRLLDAGETGVDIGANIGQNTSAMGFRSGSKGLVIAFEPHPLTFDQFKGNLSMWPSAGYAKIQAENVALGKEFGKAAMSASKDLSQAFISPGGEGAEVLVETLDKYLANVRQVGMCKIDVEGYELNVLKGAEKALSRQGIRDIIFEDFDAKPSAVTKLLADAGFTIFELHKTWLRPQLLPMGAKILKNDFSFNYLATLDPVRAKARFNIPGWRCILSL